jgi:prepilin-type N-terminal cleavage/methylation domain-containing protein
MKNSILGDKGKMMSQNVKRDERGVTLIELVIVMAIIAIMGLFMTPGIGEWVQNYRIKQAARDIASDFQFAKMKAISAHKYCTVAFTAAGYVIFPDYNNNLQLDSGNETAEIYKQVTLNHVVFDTAQSQGGNDGINFVNNAIAFDSRGMPRDDTGNFQSGTVFLINPVIEKGRRVDVTSAGSVSITEY